jgi:hypothetical protein
MIVAMIKTLFFNHRDGMEKKIEKVAGKWSNVEMVTE